MRISGLSVRAYLEAVSAMGATTFYEMLLERGQEFTPAAPLPSEIRQGMQKACFHNSERLAKRKGFRYVEGLAISSDMLGLPIHHAWNATEDGTVIDATWVPEGISYFGIVVPQDEWIAEGYRTALGVFA